MLRRRFIETSMLLTAAGWQRMARADCLYTYASPGSMYPVFDPRRASGRGPFEYGYALAWDSLLITVDRFPKPALSTCQMRVELVTSLTEPKEIQAWNLFANNFGDRIGTSGGLPMAMTLEKASPGVNCGSGTDTVVLTRQFAWPRGRTALYSFSPADFWDFWGGCHVKFDWFSDTMGSHVWGESTPQPTYPTVPLADGTLMKSASGTFFVVFGGAAFQVSDSSYLGAFSISSAIDFVDIGTTPADNTLVRELDDPKVFVCFGGAKFRVPDQLLASGYYSDRVVNVIPQGGAAQISDLPMDGTLLKELNDPKVYVLQDGCLQVTDLACVAWRNVRVVPDQALENVWRHSNCYAELVPLPRPFPFPFTR